MFEDGTSAESTLRFIGHAIRIRSSNAALYHLPFDRSERSGTYSDDSMDCEEGMKVVVRVIAPGYRDVMEHCRPYIKSNGGTLCG